MMKEKEEEIKNNIQDNKGYLVWDEDNHTTKLYKKEIKVKKLPRTGV